jgi:hypothetical protein
MVLITEVSIICKRMLHSVETTSYSGGIRLCVSGENDWPSSGRITIIQKLACFKTVF